MLDKFYTQISTISKVVSSQKYAAKPFQIHNVSFHIQIQCSVLWISEQIEEASAPIRTISIIFSAKNSQRRRSKAFVIKARKEPTYDEFVNEFSTNNCKS